MNNDNQQNKYILQSVENALSIIDLLCEHEELGVSEIGKLLNVGKSTAFRLLTTLQSKNYVYKDENSKYRLSPKFLSIGNIVPDRMEIINKVHPFLVKNKAIAAISISGPSSRMNARKDEFTSMIKNIAHKISSSII